MSMTVRVGPDTATAAWRATQVSARGVWRRVDRSLLLGTTAVAALAAALFWLLHQAIVDDAYITLVYARNLAYHFHWGLLPGQVSNTATSPLNVLLLGALTFVLRGAVDAVGVLYIANAAVLAYGLAGLGESIGVGRRLAWVGAPLLLLNPLLASTLGLETSIAVTLLVYLAWAAVRGDSRWFGVVAGLTVLARLDLAPCVAAIFLTSPALWRSLHKVAGWAGVVALPWFVFSWVALGSAIPDTLLIKQGESYNRFPTGLIEHYFPLYPWAVVGSLVIPALGVVAVVTWPAWRHRAGLRHTGVIPALGLAGAVYFVEFMLLGVPSYFWYFGPTLGVLSVCGAVALCLVTRGVPARARRPALAGAALVLLAPALVGWGIRAGDGVPLRHMPTHGNWALPGQYAEIGREMGALVGGATVKGPGEVGTLLYFCHCELVDQFSDRGRIADLIAERKRSSLLLRLNYLFLDVDELVADQADYRLHFERGPDRSGRGWNVYNPSHGSGHFELTRVSSPK